MINIEERWKVVLDKVVMRFGLHSSIELNKSKIQVLVHVFDKSFNG